MDSKISDKVPVHGNSAKSSDARIEDSGETRGDAIWPKYRFGTGLSSVPTAGRDKRETNPCEIMEINGK